MRLPRRAPGLMFFTAFLVVLIAGVTITRTPEPDPAPMQADPLWAAGSFVLIEEKSAEADAERGAYVLDDERIREIMATPKPTPRPTVEPGPRVFAKFSPVGGGGGGGSVHCHGKRSASLGRNNGANVAIGRDLAAARGWTGNQWTALLILWTCESQWSHTLRNPSSGAYGIPQSLPGSKMASAGADWQTNPATQVRWGLGYIAGRYGSPVGALGHFRSRNWY